jgi:hypothetical protein
MASDHEVAFPTLNDRDLAALAARGHPREVRSGEVLFEEGDRNLSFFVVLEGSIEIVGHSRGTPHVVTVHRPGGFTGDVDMLSGRSVMVTGRAAEDGRVLQLSNLELRRTVDELPELGDPGEGVPDAPRAPDRWGIRWRYDHRLALLPRCASLKGFVLTGTGHAPTATDAERWRAAGRAPFLLETSLPGVFAAGDVRSGSAKRVASAVGEGSMAVSFVHAHIARPL